MLAVEYATPGRPSGAGRGMEGIEDQEGAVAKAFREARLMTGAGLGVETALRFQDAEAPPRALRRSQTLWGQTASDVSVPSFDTPVALLSKRRRQM